MKAKKLTLSARPRQGTNTALRRDGALPAVLYGHGLKNQSLALDHKAFLKVFKDSGHTSLVSLTLGSPDETATTHPVLIKEVQLHPVRGHILHVDLYQVRMDEVIHAQVPLTFIGVAPAVKDQGGVLVRNMDEVSLEALPADLPHDIEIDISLLAAFDQPIRIKDIKVSAQVNLLEDPDSVVAIVQAPRSEEELEAELSEEAKEDVSSVEGVADKPAAGEGEEGIEDTGEAKTNEKAEK